MRIFKFPNESAIRRHLLAGAAMLLSVAAMPLTSLAEPSHGIAMYGEPALAADFAHLPYANPDAPKGGAIRMAEPGSFDSLKPWILRGNPVWPIMFQPGLLAETMMLRSIDEPFTLYGLLAETIETDEDRTWVEFTLRPEAKFSDGSPVTIEDVMWSYETLGTVGHPRYHGAWAKVETMEQTGERSVRFTFNVEDRELALLMGMRPILQKAQWEGQDFAQSGLEVPIGSGPYVIDRVDAGRSITFKRNPDYWGADLPVNQGLHNFDTIRYDYFGDNTAMSEAFRAGEVDIWRELSGAAWQNEYNFAAVQSGDIVLTDIENKRPSGIMGFVMNTRNPIFEDWRVRQAMIEAFNFQFINNTLSAGQDRRISSYFSNSELGMDHGPATGRVAELLEPYADELLPGTIEGYTLPEGAERNPDRQGIRRALALFDDAGWEIHNGTMVHEETGEPFVFDILLNQSGSSMRSASEMQQIVNIYVESLRGIGISPTITLLDSAQYVERRNNYDFDMTWHERALSLSPGNEQLLYWGSAGVENPGTSNLMGMNSPPAEAMISEMVNAGSHEDFVAATQALDRILTAGRYVVPVGFSPMSHLAHRAELRFPERTPLYGDWPGFMPETWWYEAR